MLTAGKLHCPPCVCGKEVCRRSPGGVCLPCHRKAAENNQHETSVSVSLPPPSPGPGFPLIPLEPGRRTGPPKAAWGTPPRSDPEPLRLASSTDTRALSLEGAGCCSVLPRCTSRQSFRGGVEARPAERAAGPAAPRRAHPERDAAGRGLSAREPRERASPSRVTAAPPGRGQARPHRSSRAAKEPRGTAGRDKAAELSVLMAFI